MRGLRSIILGSAAAVAVGLQRLMPSTMAIERQTHGSRPRRQRVPRAMQYRVPDLNRAKRHPVVHSYREAADLSERMGLRDRPLR